MKKITLIIQSKGGVGKSALAYMLANKIEDLTHTLWVDMDNETKTSFSQLAFVPKVVKYDLINPITRNIDRSAFDQFFDFFLESKRTNAICDLGATTSEQFLTFLKVDDGISLLIALTKMEVQIQVLCVVGGVNAFPASSKYCKELFDALKDIEMLKRVIVKNNYTQYTKEQQDAINKLAEATNASIEGFTVVPNNVPGTLTEIHGLMEQGKPISEAKTFTKIRMQKSIRELNIEI